MIRLSTDGTQIECEGAWVLSNVSQLNVEIKPLLKNIKNVTHIDTGDVTQLDTAGALSLHDLFAEVRKACSEVDISSLPAQFQSLFSLVSSESQKITQEDGGADTGMNPFSAVGQFFYNKWHQSLLFIHFIGELIVLFFQFMVKPRRVKWRSIFKIIDETGYSALPITALMNFLIGIVLAYQLTAQLTTYGATIFMVKISGVAILREFAPLITAVIIAGRTSTSFAALIGTMKVNEEIDALSTMGVSPIRRLVMPRILGLIVVLPLLAVCGDVFGVLGSMVMGHTMADIPYKSFLELFRDTVAVEHLILGLVKMPVFAIIIAGVGCFQGFRTKMSAESVGWQTTKSAVQSIFLIIVADAAFSILFNAMGF
jgi:phospholipid/cholesterol/gamma-HCH transport system permease protein